MGQHMQQRGGRKTMTISTQGQRMDTLLNNVVNGRKRIQMLWSEYKESKGFTHVWLNAAWNKAKRNMK